MAPPAERHEAVQVEVRSTLRTLHDVVDLQAAPHPTGRRPASSWALTCSTVDSPPSSHELMLNGSPRFGRFGPQQSVPRCLRARSVEGDGEPHSPELADERCGRPFIKRKRQTYCTSKCSQLVRTHKYRQAHRERLRAGRRGTGVWDRTTGSHT